MSIPDKVAAAKKINEFLTAVVTHGGLRLKYRIIVDPPLPENRDWEKPEILVDFSGPDSALLLDRGGELLRALELIGLEMLRLPSGSMRRYRSTARTSGRCASRNFAPQPPWRPRKCGERGRRMSSVPCRPGSGGLFTLPCATKRTCGPRVRAKGCGGVWWCIPRITSRQESRPRGLHLKFHLGGICDNIVCHSG
jgi:hypothetical protein